MFSGTATHPHRCVHDALAQHVDEEDKTTALIQGTGSDGTQTQRAGIAFRDPALLHFTFSFSQHAFHATRGSHSSQRCRQDGHHHLNDGSPKIFVFHNYIYNFKIYNLQFEGQGARGKVQEISLVLRAGCKGQENL